jgi:hypothetical protein
MGMFSGLMEKEGVETVSSVFLAMVSLLGGLASAACNDIDAVLSMKSSPLRGTNKSETSKNPSCQSLHPLTPFVGCDIHACHAEPSLAEPCLALPAASNQTAPGPARPYLALPPRLAVPGLVPLNPPAQDIFR